MDGRRGKLVPKWVSSLGKISMDPSCAHFRLCSPPEIQWPVPAPTDG